MRHGTRQLLVSARAMAQATATWPGFAPPRGRILHRR